MGLRHSWLTHWYSKSRKDKENSVFIRSFARTNLNSKKETDHPDIIHIKATIQICNPHYRLHNVCKNLWFFCRSSVELNLLLLLQCVTNSFTYVKFKVSSITMPRRNYCNQFANLVPMKCAITPITKGKLSVICNG